MQDTVFSNFPSFSAFLLLTKISLWNSCPTLFSLRLCHTCRVFILSWLLNPKLLTKNPLYVQSCPKQRRAPWSLCYINQRKHLMCVWFRQPVSWSRCGVGYSYPMMPGHLQTMTGVDLPIIIQRQRDWVWWHIICPINKVLNGQYDSKGISEGKI